MHETPPAMEFHVADAPPRTSRRRDEFPFFAKRAIEKRANSRCSNPGCLATTSGPHTDSERAVSIGVAAHITAASPKGPRFDPLMTRAQRRSVSNGIWLCARCGDLVDEDVQRFTVEVLRRWKAAADAQAQMMMGFPSSPIEVVGQNGCALPCPFCGFESQYGLRVCRGCQAEILYAATANEIQRAAVAGAGVVVILVLCLSDILGAGFLRSSGIGIVAVLACAVSLTAATQKAKKLKGVPRFTRLMTGAGDARGARA